MREHPPHTCARLMSFMFQFFKIDTEYLALDLPTRHLEKPMQSSSPIRPSALSFFFLPSSRPAPAPFFLSRGPQFQIEACWRECRPCGSRRLAVVSWGEGAR